MKRRRRSAPGTRTQDVSQEKTTINAENMMLAYTASELSSIFTMQGFAGLSLFSVLLLMALGLAIIFGQMGVINMAHGEFMAAGAYTVYLCSQLTAKYAPAFQPYYFLVAIVAAFLVAGT